MTPLERKEAQRLADDHWDWLEPIIEAIPPENRTVTLIGYLFKTAITHGWKHRAEKVGNGVKMVDNLSMTDIEIKQARFQFSKVLALLSTELDKLPVIGDEEIANALQPTCDDEAKTYYCSDTTAITCINCNSVAQAQLDDIKRQLKGLFGI